VFEVVAGSGSITTLATFNGSNGSDPSGGLVQDSRGNLFGTTWYGGNFNYGTVFEVVAGSGSITTLATLNSSSGAHPLGGLVEDSSGNLFGTTFHGGPTDGGTLFEVVAGSGRITTLADFNNTSGSPPEGGLIEDSQGNLFGTTYGGGVLSGGAGGYGTVFEVAAGSGSITTLATFNFSDGAAPEAGLFIDSRGNLFGTTTYGGAYPGPHTFGDGTVFELAAGSGSITTLASFNGDDGICPQTGVVEDSSGNLFGTDNPSGTANPGYGTVYEVAAGSGSITTLASFNSFNGANPYTGLIMDSSGNLYGTTANGGTIGDGTVFELTGAAVALPHFQISGIPSSTSAGTSQTFTVTVQNSDGSTDTNYTGTVHFTSSDLQAGLPADYTFISADAGVHTFSATLKTAGTQSITATDTVTASVTGSQSGIVVTAAATSKLVVAGFPSPVVADTASSFTVTAVDAYGNAIVGYRGTVHFTSGDPRVSLPANYTFIAADNGAHTFSATLKTAGTQSLTATDTVTGSITGSQTGIQVTPAAVSKLAVAAFPSPVAAGTPGSFTVTAEDAYGNTVTMYRGTVHFTSGDPRVSLPANYTFIAADNGAHTFSATFRTAGTQSITAADTVTSTIKGAQTGIVVTPNVVTHFNVALFPSPEQAGVTGSFRLMARDAYNNTVPTYTGTVHFTSSDPNSAARLPANYTFTGTDKGIHTFHATLVTAGTQSITATDTVTASVTGSQSGIVVTAAAMSKLVVAGFPSPVIAGTEGSVTVTAADAYGNTTPSYRGTVHFTSSDSSAGLPAPYTFTPADGGAHTFSVTLKLAGTQSVTAADTGSAGLAGTQAGITVAPGPASSITATSGMGQSTPFGTGFAQPLVVTVTDDFGNGVPAVSVTFTTPATGPGSSVTGATAITGANGQASQTVSANGIAGNYRVSAAVAGVALPAVFPLINLPATIRGTVFQDINGNGVQDAASNGVQLAPEPPLAGQTVFLDLAGSGVLKPGDPTALTDATGRLAFTIQAAGTFTLQPVLLGGVLLGMPASGSAVVAVTGGGAITGPNFAEVPTSITVPLTLPMTTPFPRHGYAPADYVEALYRAILHRDADPGGLASWTSQFDSGALTRLQVVQRIRQSQEHVTQEVTDFYFTLLGRAPDAPGLQSWVQNLENGMTEEQVAFRFLDSPEYLDQGDKYFVDHMYLSLLGRSFDAPGEANWLAALGDDAAGNPVQPATLTHEQVISQFMRSPESLTRLVEGYYQVFLKRLADPQGLSDWLTALEQGDSFLAIGQQFLSSDEFYNDAVAEG
jgi:uncharacterized repeat protein (TIGR03803 family)